MSGPAFWLTISGWLVAGGVVLWHFADTLFPDELIYDDEAEPPARPPRSHVRVAKGPADWDHRGWA